MTAEDDAPTAAEFTPPTGPLDPEPMPENVRTIQPGGGFVMSCELYWGHVRRAIERTFRRDYIRRMEEKRVGDVSGLPWPIHDPRDLKYLRNQTTAHWPVKDDPFKWRDSLPFARWGLAELVLMTGASVLVCVLCLWGMAATESVVLRVLLGLLALTGGLFAAEFVWFFRDPPRSVPTAAGELCSPADGTVAEITQIEDEFCGPAVRVGVFLSIFNVHINRVPDDVRVIGVSYKPGKMLNALRPESARENERLELRVQQTAAPWRPYRIVQITGALARRIVCEAKPGDVLRKGHKYGMIKLGSRTELIIPAEDGLEVCVDVGDKIQAGQTVIARYGDPHA